MKKALFVPMFFLFSVLVVAIMQVFASIAGLVHLFQLHEVLAFLVSLLLLFVPGVGALLGVYGAVAAWGWHPVWALLLFFWPYVLYGILALLGLSSAIWGIRNLKKSRPNVIDAEYIVKTHTIRQEDKE